MLLWGVLPAWQAYVLKDYVGASPMSANTFPEPYAACRCRGLKSESPEVVRPAYQSVEIKGEDGEGRKVGKLHRARLATCRRNRLDPLAPGSWIIRIKH